MLDASSWAHAVADLENSLFPQFVPECRPLLERQSVSVSPDRSPLRATLPLVALPWAGIGAARWTCSHSPDTERWHVAR